MTNEWMKPVFKHGDIVQLATDPDLVDRMVIAYVITPECILYQLTYGDMISTHYAIEIVQTELTGVM